MFSFEKGMESTGERFWRHTTRPGLSRWTGLYISSPTDLPLHEPADVVVIDLTKTTFHTQPSQVLLTQYLITTTGHVNAPPIETLSTATVVDEPFPITAVITHCSWTGSWKPAGTLGSSCAAEVNNVAANSSNAGWFHNGNGNGPHLWPSGKPSGSSSSSSSSESSVRSGIIAFAVLIFACFVTGLVFAAWWLKRREKRRQRGRLRNGNEVDGQPRPHPGDIEDDTMVVGGGSVELEIEDRPRSAALESKTRLIRVDTTGKKWRKGVERRFKEVDIREWALGKVQEAPTGGLNSDEGRRILEVIRETEREMDRIGLPIDIGSKMVTR